MASNDDKKMVQGMMDAFMLTALRGLTFNGSVQEMLEVFEGDGVQSIVAFLRSVPSRLREEVKVRGGDFLPMQQNPGRFGMSTMKVRKKAIEPLQLVEKPTGNMQTDYVEPEANLSFRRRCILLLERSANGLDSSEVQKALGVTSAHARSILHDLYKKKKQIDRVAVSAKDRAWNGPRFRYTAKVAA